MANAPVPESPELIFPASRTKAVLLLLGCSAFVAVMIWMADSRPLIGWAGAAFFALGVPTSIFMLLPKSMYLRLTTDGFEMRSPVRTTFIHWSQVERFELCSIRGTRMIAIIHNRSYSEQKAFRAAAYLLSGVEGAVPNNYRASLAEVLAALTEWHSRYRQPLH